MQGEFAPIRPRVGEKIAIEWGGVDFDDKCSRRLDSHTFTNLPYRRHHIEIHGSAKESDAEWPCGGCYISALRMIGGHFS
jgi:hypothetical protein